MTNVSNDEYPALRLRSVTWYLSLVIRNIRHLEVGFVPFFLGFVPNCVVRV